MCCFNLCHPFHVCFFCFLSMQAIHSTFFFIFHYFSSIFHSMLCSIYRCSFQLCHYYFVNQCCVVSFPIFLFVKLFAGCQSYTGLPPLPVARKTGFPFMTSSWLHSLPIHHELPATQGAIHCQWLATQGSHLSSGLCRQGSLSLPVAGYSGFPIYQQQ